jgi:DNA-directed RNA polymerase I, II, and III subunit RPABC1
MDSSIADILVRSRHTILEILSDRGYDTTPYELISPDQILTLAEGHPRALDIVVNKKSDGLAPCEKAVVVYQLQDRIRLKLGTFLRDIYDKPPDNSTSNAIKPTDDLIILLNEPYNDAFDKVAIQMWQNHKSRVTFFHIKQVVVNMSRHVLVPPHRKLTPEEAKAEMTKLRVTQKSQLPLIKHHDMQSRILGLVPGDIVEVLRPSPTSGINRILRICAA